MHCRTAAWSSGRGWGTAGGDGFCRLAAAVYTRRRHDLAMVHFRRPILRFVLAVVSRPRLTLAITLTLTAACVALSVARLRISTEQNKLFSRNVPFFRDYVAFSEEFPENEAIYVIVEPKDRRAHPAVERWTGAAEAIVERLKQIPQHVEGGTARGAPEEL